MERKILGIKITDKIPNEEISVKTNILNIIKHITNTKWRWARHVARMQDNRWTIRTTEWQVGKGRRLGADPKWDGKMTSWSGREQHGRDLQKTERSRKNLRRATSSSGGTQPMFKVQGTIRGGGGGAAVAQSVKRATPGEEVLGSIPTVAARSLLVGSVSV